MKSIELTKEHKSKLLEMCKTLFPEYTTIQFGNQSNYYLESEEILDFYNDKEDFSIHWFEFCQCHLLPKLIKSYEKRIQYFIDTFTENPVDYLYEEFKKLKL